MAMIVKHNLQAMNANRMLGVNSSTLSKSVEKLSSGYRVNRAADDAAGLEVHDMLQRMNELAVQAANGTNQTEDQGYIQLEIRQLIAEISRTANDTTFNEKKLLSAGTTVNLQVGTESGNTIQLAMSEMTAASIGVKDVDVSDEAKARDSLDDIKNGIKSVSSLRATLGAVQNRLEHTVNNLDNVVENTTSSEATIRDTDMASEMVTYSNNQILAQAGQAMLAQANTSNQGVLSLLQ